LLVLWRVAWGATSNLAPAAAYQRRFQLVLIKPSHYDADGYVIQWARSGIPSNSLASVYALAYDAAQRQVLGSDVAIDITAIDETNSRVRVKDIIAQFKRHDGFGMVGLVGAQSNQFPRTLDLAAAVSPSRHPGGDRRLSRFRLHRHAARDAGRSESRARHGVQPVRWRSRRGPH
jgi:hypothetical protein